LIRRRPEIINVSRELFGFGAAGGCAELLTLSVGQI
jgi:hypothetical protein